MKAKRTTKTLVITSLILLIGGTIAFAHGGWGYGGYGGHMMGPGYRGHMMGPGYGGHMMGYGPGWGMGYGYGDISKEDAAKLEDARNKFFEETRDLRSQIEDRQIDLRDELAKETPDSNKVMKLQKELSKLEGDFDQKAIQHRLEMRKLFPEKDRGRGFGPGYGYGRGGYCWQ